MAIPVTEKQKQSPLYKYYELDIAPVPEELSKKIMSMTWEHEGGLPIQEMNRLFDDGYLPGEFGMYALPDGGTMIANLTDMPGVTPEMFDWWFAWHGLDSFRYTIWDKDDHYYCQSLNVEQNLDTSLSMKERYWNTTHDTILAHILYNVPQERKEQTALPQDIGRHFKGNAQDISRGKDKKEEPAWREL